MLAKYLIGFTLLLLLAGCNNADKKNTTATNSTLVDDLRKKVDPATAKSFEDALKKINDDPVAFQHFGHYAYFNRQIETAAWLYAQAAVKKPGDVNNQSNLALCLHEMSLKDSSKNLLKEAITILEKAADDDDDNAAVQNNLGYAYYQQWLDTKDASLLTKAEAAFRKAISLDPKTSIYHSHLAAVLQALKKTAEAVQSLNNAFRRQPFDGVLVSTAASIPEYAAAKDSRSFCDSINFKCMQTCPPSIIGRIKIVNCEIAQQDARMACEEGKPFATGFNCDEEMPITGFMIPGLQSGFGFFTPWGKITVMMQGGGKVDYKIEFNTGVPGVRFSAAGRYDPSSGMSASQIGGNISVNLYNQGSVAPALNKFNMGPASIKINQVTNDAGNNGISMEAYDTPVKHIH
jgi:tetratricopeptide (TPR) repeat protein